MHRLGPSACRLRCRCILAVAGLLCLTPLSALPQAARPGPQQTGPQAFPSQQRASQTPPGGAPVILDGRNVVEIRWGYKTLTPVARAARISKILKEIGNDPSAPRFSVQPEEVTVDVMSGETLVASVFDGDAKAAGTSREELAHQWATAMQREVDRYRAEHSWRLKLIRLSLGILTILGCVGLLVLIRAVMRQLMLRATAILQERTARADRRIALFLAHEQMRTLIVRSFSALRLVLSLIVLWATLHLLLSIFPSTRPTAERMRNTVLGPVRSFADAFVASLPKLIFVLLVIVITWYVVKFVHFFFRRIRAGEITFEHFRPAWALPTDRLVTIALIILALLIAYPYIPGSESPAFKGISLFLGVLVSLGSTGLVANAVTGVSLTYVDAFDLGDYVQIGEVVGWITKMGTLTTRVRTRKNEIITLPNSVVTSKEIINFSKAGDQGVVVSSKVGIGYDAPWRQVEGMLKLAARRTGGIRATPEPFVLELSLNTFDITYEINAFLEQGGLLYVVLAELNRNILDAFNEFGVQIMTPAYIADPQREKVVPRERWHQPPAPPSDLPEPDTGASKAAD